MLKIVRSSYFIKLLFFHLDEKQKLKVVKYSKRIQKNLNISLINYKYYSGRYIIYESNEKGKEYDFNFERLIYEGEYLNGERNGKGKEYDNKGDLIFKGEYLNNRRWKGYEYNDYFSVLYGLNEDNGLIREYDDDDNIIYEGEYLNKKRNGKGKEYYDYYDDILKFEGEYLNGKKNGKGKEYYTNKI